MVILGLRFDICHLAWPYCVSGGSSNGHSPVLNLSKSGADQSGSEAGHTGLEDDDEDDNVSDVDEDDDKDQGKDARIQGSCAILRVYMADTLLHLEVKFLNINPLSQ